MIRDALTKNPLPGAAISINDETANYKSDLNGQFVLQNVISGSKIKVEYMGYMPYTMEMRAHQKFITIDIQAVGEQIQEVKVSASIEGEQKALNQQRTADNIKNIISADVMGRFPDLNVAEALQRVPGVNIQRDKGEGATMSLRGTPQHFTTVQINGEQIPSVQQGGSRNEALDLIPADQLASMEIIKAATPDLDGDAIGGIVNLRTPTANKLRWSGKAEASLGYNDISGGLNGIGKLRLDKRFFATETVPVGKLGIMLSGSYYSSNNSEDRTDANWNRWGFSDTRTEIVPMNYSLRKTANERTRTGLTATGDYRFNAFHHLIFNYMYNRRKDDDTQNRFRYDLDRSDTKWIEFNQIDQARVRRDFNMWDELKINHNFNLQGYHTMGAWQLDWGAFYTRSFRDHSSDRGDFAREGIDLLIEQPEGIYAELPAFRPANSAFDLFNPMIYEDFRRYEEDSETTEADNFVFKADVSRQTTLADHPLQIKIGGKYRTQSNSKYRYNRVLAFKDPNNVLNQAEAFTRIIGNTEPANFMFSQYRFGPLVDRDKFTDYIYKNRFLLEEGDDAWDARRLSLNDTYDAYEDILAGYALGKINIDKLMILTGLRVESNKVQYDAFEVFRRGTNVEAEPISGGNDYVFLLPHLHAKYQLSNWSNLRFSLIRNYARPNFVDIVPFVNYDIDALQLQIGNPNLQPSSAWNADLMWERYFANAGILSVGVFYKNIEKFQFSQIVPALTEPYPGYPESQGFRFSQEQNGLVARVGGLEVNFFRSLDFLPGILKGLAVNANYTFAHSNAHTAERQDIALPGQAKHTFNGMLSFDYKDFTVRGSVNYNGSYAQSIAGDVDNDIIQKYRTQFDLSASYKWKKYRIYTEWINLLNEPSIRYQGQENRISRMAYFGYAARWGLSYSF